MSGHAIRSSTLPSFIARVKDAIAINMDEPASQDHLLESAELTTEQGFALLQQSSERFLAFRQQPRAHFAFGDLSLAQYEAAHCLHILNHLDAFTSTMTTV